MRYSPELEQAGGGISNLLKDLWTVGTAIKGTQSIYLMTMRNLVIMFRLLSESNQRISNIKFNFRFFCDYGAFHAPEANR